MALVWFVGNTVLDNRPGITIRRPPTSIFGPGRRGRFVAPDEGSDVWVGAIELDPPDAAQLATAGAVVFTGGLQDIVSAAAKTKLIALGVPSAVVNGAATVRELLREAAQAPDDTFDRLEERVIGDRARRP